MESTCEDGSGFELTINLFVVADVTPSSPSAYSPIVFKQGFKIKTHTILINQVEIDRLIKLRGQQEYFKTAVTDSRIEFSIGHLKQLKTTLNNLKQTLSEYCQSGF